MKMILQTIKRTAFFLVFGLTYLCNSGSSYAQAADAFTFQQLDSLQKKERKPVLVFIHTSWCRYCEAMEQTTFKNGEVKALLDEHFYFIKLNAEEKQDIILGGRRFQYRPTGAGTGQHELAQALGSKEGKVSFPTLCFLSPENEIVYQQAGFTSAKQLIKILKLLKSQW